MRVALIDSIPSRCQSAEPSSKARKSEPCLQRYDSISRAAKGIGSILVHHHGHPSSHEANAGFNRRGEVGPALEDSGPEVGTGTGREKQWATKFGNWSMCIRPEPVWVTCISEFAPFASRAAGVGHDAVCALRFAAPWCDSLVTSGPPVEAFGLAQNVRA